MMHAMAAGVDVYGEKPLTLTIEEGRILADAARKSGRILQTGTQQRSMPINRHCSKLVREGAIGEIKKGKYIYYRCTHYKTDCNEPYVREEVLEEKFTDILRILRFDEEVLEWIRTALKESHDDETRYHREVVDKLQKEYKRLEQRLEAMYVDKLDGKIGERFYEQKSAEWREDQQDILRRLARRA